MAARRCSRRLQQFASRIYGPVVAAGSLAGAAATATTGATTPSSATAAFAELLRPARACRGKPPFGGHDPQPRFRRGRLDAPRRLEGGLAHDLPGSYEQGAADPDRLAARDRRWCQGNLQHMRLLGTAGLHPLSRLHLVMGMMCYLASPLWLLFLLSGMSLALHAYLVPPDYFLDRWSLFPDWPRIDPERAMALFGICMLVLYVPKLLGTANFLGQPQARAACGIRVDLRGPHRARSLGALVAPIMMLVQTSSVVADPDRTRQRLEPAGARLGPGALAASLALPQPPRPGRRGARPSPPARSPGGSWPG